MLAAGADERGTVYALTELADRVACSQAGRSALEFGEPVVLGPKYCGEHLGLPYQQAAIRERELSPAGSLKDTGKYSPLEVAQWLEDIAAASGQSISLARRQLGAQASKPGFRRIEENVLIQKPFAPPAKVDDAAVARALKIATDKPVRASVAASHAPVERSRVGEPLRISLSVSAPAPRRVTLRYRHVNQAEGCHAIELKREDGVSNMPSWRTCMA